MDISKCYLMALQKSEQNLANGGIKMDKARFVFLFNAAQDRLIRYYINRKDDETIRSIQKFLVNWKQLTKDSISIPGCSKFVLPPDFFWFSDIRGVFRIGKCVSNDFTMWEAKNENVHELLGDDNNKPSFDYRETFYTIGDNGVLVYEDGFITDSLSMTYYRLPKHVDISGYTRSDNTQSSNIDPEIDDWMIEDVLNMAIKQFSLNESEYNRYGLDKDNVNSPL